MILERVRVKNFRCIQDVALNCDSLTVFVGPNGAGKSSFLRAIELFYEPNANYTEEDFFAGDTLTPIEVEITFGGLSRQQELEFEPYIQNSSVAIVKRMTWPRDRSSQRYHGYRLVHPRFASIRELSSAREQKPIYESLRQLDDYAELPHWTNQPESLAALQAWEEVHPRSCEPMLDDGQFFGFGRVGESGLERHIVIVFIPAVKEAAEVGSEGRETPLTQLMDLVVREALKNREDLTQLREDARTGATRVFNRAKEVELQRLEEVLSNDLSRLARGAGIRLEWSLEDFEIPLPRASVRLVENGYPATVATAGHGLQRLFIMALLQRLAEATLPQQIGPEGGEQGGQERAPELPATIVLAIEEPELYQHPNRQRSLSRVFRTLAQGEIPGTASRVQIMYTTHSPMFLDVEHFDQVVLFRKDREAVDGIKTTRVTSTSMEALTREMERVWQRQSGSFSSEVTREKLRLLLTSEVNEGFFADVVVLVEGPEDKALLLGYAASRDVSFEDSGVSVISCGGKENLTRPAAVFSRLAIPTYVIWDNDRGVGSPEQNRRLLRLLNETELDFPADVFDSYAVFDRDAESVVRDEIGSAYPRLLSTVASNFDNSPVASLRFNPRFIESVFRRASDQGLDSSTLSLVLEKILSLGSN